MAGFFEVKAQLAEAGRKPASPATGVLSVSQLTAQIKATLKGAFPKQIAVQGEVSNLSRPNQSGHLYFSIKDAGAVLPVAMFAQAARGLKFELQDGLEVIASGRLDVYEAGGRYNFVASSLVPVGMGALELAYQQLYAKLEGEGLFSPERKRPIPPYPRTIAVLTSRTAAALQDILKVLRRFPFLRVVVVPVPVQGEGAADKIAKALEGVNRVAESLGGVDVILLGRGGGSFEDLFEFSREVVARAVAASAIPVVTGIGHEVDTAIADLVADHHAHTPTEAATFVTRYWAHAAEFCRLADGRLTRRMEQVMAEARRRLERVARAAAFSRPQEFVERRHQRVDEIDTRLSLGLTGKLAAARRGLEGVAARLSARDPRRVLQYRHKLLFSAEGRLGGAMQRRFRGWEGQLTQVGGRLERRGPGALLERLSAKLTAAEGQLRVLGPESVLARGYSITRRPDGSVVRRAAEVAAGEVLITRLADGEVRSRVE